MKSIGCPSIYDLAELFAADFTHLQCREICEAASGFKLSRVNVFSTRVNALVNWCKQHRLSIEISDFSVQEFLAEEGKGTWCNIGRRVNSDIGVKYCYVSSSAREARLGKELDAKIDSTSLELAKLFKIPECCADFFMRNKQMAYQRYADDYALITLKSTPSMPYYPCFTNYLSQYFGYSLIHHYPCRWDCPASIERAKTSINIINAVSKQWLNTFCQNLCGVMIFENRRAVHFIQGILSQGSIQFHPEQVRSTSANKLTRALRNAGQLTWLSPYEFHLQDYVMKEKDTVETAIIPFCIQSDNSLAEINYLID